MYKGNRVKTYTLIWDSCTRRMQNQILSVPNYETEIKGDPVSLMKAIKYLSLNAQDLKYLMAIMLDAMHTLFKCRQKESENLQDYTC